MLLPKRVITAHFNMIILIFNGLQLNSLVSARAKLIFSLSLQGGLWSTLFQLLDKTKEDKSSSKFSFADPSLGSLNLSLSAKLRSPYLRSFSQSTPATHLQLLGVYSQYIFCTLRKHAQFDIIYVCIIDLFFKL